MDDKPTAARTATVTFEDTAARYGAEFPEAAATPFVLGISEMTCHDAVADRLESGQITVGLSAEIQHLAPTPVGARITAHAVETERQGNKIQFSVEVRDEAGLCARITHTRAIVDRKVIAELLLERVAPREA